MLSRLGVQRDTVVAYVLPNLPETHFVVWGGEAVGIVCAINPLLESDAIGELLNASGASVLITLAPHPGKDLWPKVQAILHKLASLRRVGGDAVRKRSDGIVIIDPEKARGRKDIVKSCPYKAIVWNEELQVPQTWIFDAHLLDQGWQHPRCEQVCPARLRDGQARRCRHGGKGPT
ncbi:acyl-CoA synthetase (AMP-forming)/AMP-acid ligase II [Paraburkholderia sp. JPY419]